MNTTIIYSLGNTLQIPISDSDCRKGSCTLEINSDSHEAPIITQNITIVDGEGAFELSEEEIKKLKIGNYIYRIIFTDTNSITTEWSGILKVIYGAANEKNGIMIPTKLNLEIIDSADSATKPGIYAIEDAAIVFHSKYRQILLVSDYIEAAMGDYTLFQTLIDAESGSIKTRKYIDNVWTAWETIGKVDLSNYIKNTDYADYGIFGIIKPGDGIGVVNGVISTKVADGSLISGRSSAVIINEVITPSNLNMAVKAAISDDNRINDMTDTEKENARGVIGAIGSTELNNYYTKSEIDSKVSSVYKYKGTVPSAMLLPFNKEVGDVYNTTFAGYVYCTHDENFTLTGISSSDGESISMNSEITLTFDKNISEVGKVVFVGTGADIAFWFDSSNFFIGKLISFSSNSIVVKMADLDVTNTGYLMNPVFDSVVTVFSNFHYSGTTSMAIESIRYFAATEIDFQYEYIPKGGNVAYCGDGGGNNGWDSLGSTIDTSNFATKNEMNNAIASAITATLNTEV